MIRGSVSEELRQAHALQARGRLEEAAEILRQAIAREPRKAIELQPSNPTIHANLGSALSALGQHTEAAGAYQRAAALKPDFLAAFRGRGQALMRIGEAGEALASFQHAMRLAPGDAQIHNDVGVALERLGRR